MIVNCFTGIFYRQSLVAVTCELSIIVVNYFQVVTFVFLFFLLLFSAVLICKILLNSNPCCQRLVVGINEAVVTADWLTLLACTVISLSERTFNPIVCLCFTAERCEKPQLLFSSDITNPETAHFDNGLQLVSILSRI